MNTLDLVYIVFGGGTYPIWSRKARGGWDARFGKGAMLANPVRARIMLHAVSVGEVNALRKLVPMLAEQADVVVTTTTDTGMKQARALFADRDDFACQVLRYPLDFSWAVDRFLTRVRPDVVALVELEVWPNFIIRCKRRGIPVGVINGRLSDSSIRGYRWGRAMIGSTFRRLDFVCAQDEQYADRFRSMGIDPSIVSVTGSMKWDAVDASEDGTPTDEAIALRDELGIDPETLLIVAGSTSKGEEALLHRACPTGVQLLCAPRKPERFDNAARDLAGCVRVSELRRGSSVGIPATADNHNFNTPTAIVPSKKDVAASSHTSDRFLLDSLGDLSSAYRLADIVVLGRSFFSGQAGSDPLEPAGLGKPVVLGTHVGNFRHAVHLLEDAGGLVQCSRSALGAHLARLCADEQERLDQGVRARECVSVHRGASIKHMEKLLDLAQMEPAWADIGDSGSFDALGAQQTSTMRTHDEQPEGS